MVNEIRSFEEDLTMSNNPELKKDWENIKLIFKGLWTMIISIVKIPADMS